MIGYDQLPRTIKLFQTLYFVSHDADSVHQTDEHIKAAMDNALSPAYPLQAIAGQHGQHRENQKPQ